MKRIDNVMQQLVLQELENQLGRIPAKQTSFLEVSEMLTFALNQLPALHATSEEGLETLLNLGMSKYGMRIKSAVRNAIATIKNNPFRPTRPLHHPQDVPSENLWALIGDLQARLSELTAENERLRHFVPARAKVIALPESFANPMYMR
jgi:hypothetical protein